MTAQTPETTNLPAVSQPMLDELQPHLDDFKAELSRLPDAIKTALAPVWISSPWIRGICLRRRGLLSELCIDSDELMRARGHGEYQQHLQQIAQKSDSRDHLGQQLRLDREREMLRIAWRDIAGWADLTETLRELTDYADAVLATVSQYLNEQLAGRYGQPVNDAGQAMSLIILAMGKLGGGELNFSSDIDLIFAYDEEGHTPGTGCDNGGGGKSISHEAYFGKLTKQLVALLNEQTAEGRVYRVDTRLRPFGHSGPIAMSVPRIETYYQQHGREWERYALIKARAVGHDPSSGKALLKLLQPFVYRRYLDYNSLESMRDMKRMIQQEVARKSLETNIKLGSGGIREIEFIVQVFQMIHAGKEPDLQGRSLFKVLQTLADNGHMASEATQELRQAYVFLRRLENRLQMYGDQQTHDLPVHDAPRSAIALAMGYDNWSSLHEDIFQWRGRVQDHFSQVFAEHEDSEADSQWVAVWASESEPEAAYEELTQAGYQNPERVMKLVTGLRDGAFMRALGKMGRRRADQLIPLLLDHAAEQSEPDTVLERVLKIIEAISGRAAYLGLLAENPGALSRVLDLCGASPWIARQLAATPALLDEMLDDRSLFRPPRRSELQQTLTEQLCDAPQNDLEHEMDLLRRYKQAQVLRVAAADVSGAMPLMVVSDHLTEIAEIVIGHALEMAWRQMRERHGTPRLSDSGKEAGFTVLAFGKLGGIELGYGSDLDLVFIYEGEGASDHDKKPLDNSVYFSRLGQKLIHALSTPTAAGVCYEVDMRLRPSGASGLLVSAFEAYASYQQNQAWVWEHQALVRARPVAGDGELAQRFIALRQALLAKVREPVELLKEVIAMRAKMREHLEAKQDGYFDLKQGRGGIADIEFMVQYSVLHWSAEYPDICVFTDNIRQIEALARAELWSEQEASDMTEAYRLFRRRSHAAALQEVKAIIDDNTDLEHREKVQTLWDRLMHADTGTMRDV